MHREDVTQRKLFRSVSICTGKLPHTEAFTHSKQTQQAFTLGSFYTEKILHRASFFTEQAFAQRSPSTEKLLHKASSYTEQPFLQSKLLHREAFTQSKLLHTEKNYTEKLHIKLLHKEKLLHREAFAQSKLLRREAFTHSKLLHREAATQDAPIRCQSTIRNLMLPLQYDLRLSAAKQNSITHAPAAARNLDAAIPLRAETELRNAIELRATATQIAAPKPDLFLDAQAEKRRF